MARHRATSTHRPIHPTQLIPWLNIANLCLWGLLRAVQLTEAITGLWS